MNDNDFDLTARAWLDDGPTRMSDRAVLSALEEIHTTRQRRALWPAWRATPVSIFVRVASAAVLVIAVGLLAINVVPRQPDGSSVGGPSPSPSPARAVDFPDLTTTFVSARNGFSIMHPDRVALTPATNISGFGDDWFDVVETGLAAVFKGASTEMPHVENGFLAGSDIPLDEWIDGFLTPEGCGAPRSKPSEITIDGQPSRISEDCPNEIRATVVAGGRLYLFTLLHDRSDARAVFDAFAATIDLTPETAVGFPKPDTTFVSPTNGFTVRYYDRGGLTAAQELWDPVNQPPFDQAEFFRGHSTPLDDGFDFIDTGFGAVLYGASTEIPDGVSIDAWVDASVAKYLPGGCRVPRSQQAEITIDGQSGRMQDCPETVMATVVVDERLYLFMLLHNRSDARAFFDAFTATIDLRPEDAAVPSSSP